MSPGVSPETVHAFCLSTIETLFDATGVDAAIDHDVDPDELIPDPITILLHARGDLSGLTWTFPTALTREAATRMIPGIDIDRAICEAAAGELANILTGRGAVTFERNGYRIDIEPPEIAVVGAPGEMVRFATSCGPIEVVFHPTIGGG